MKRCSLLLVYQLTLAGSQRGVDALANSSPMRSRTFMITGATDGIGKHTSQRLASNGHALLIHGRKAITDEAVTSMIGDLEKRGAAKVAYLQADLNDLFQVELLADGAVEVLRDWQKKDVPGLDVLINNAGVFDPEPRHSAQGYDSTMAVNVLAPFVLTRKLLPSLVHGNEPRIITTSSISQSWQLPDLDSLFARKSETGAYDNKPLSYSAHSFYSHSKLGDLMITAQLARLLSNYEMPLNQKNNLGLPQMELLDNLRRIQCLTMDPGTVNTKMLLAGK